MSNSPWLICYSLLRGCCTTGGCCPHPAAPSSATRNAFESHLPSKPPVPCRGHCQAQDRRSSSKDCSLKRFPSRLQEAQAKFKGNTRAQGSPASEQEHGPSPRRSTAPACPASQQPPHRSAPLVYDSDTLRTNLASFRLPIRQNNCIAVWLQVTHTNNCCTENTQRCITT